MPLQVLRSAVAEGQIAAIREEGEAKPDKAQGAKWNAIRRVLVEYLPEHGLNTSDRKKGNLDGIRARHVGREVVVWIASAEKQTVTVLMIGFRKDGDKHDVYTLLPKYLNRGTFDDCFAELEIPKPGETEPPARSTPPAAVNETGTAAPTTGDGGDGEPQE